jgi:hypothetical protein
LILKQIELNKTKMKKALIVFLVTLTISATYAQIGINDNGSAPHSSAQLDVKSTTKAFYPPRMTTVQKNAIVSPQAGAVVFDKTLNQLSFYNGSSWVAASGGGLTLPYNQSQSVVTGNTGGLFKITNTETTGIAVAINGSIASQNGYAIRGTAQNTNAEYTTAIIGENLSTNNNGSGIAGQHNGGGYGVSGYSDLGTAIYGFSNLVNGVEGFSVVGTGVKGQSLSGIGVLGLGSTIGGSFSSNSGYALITETGNVGIGTNTPTAKMDIKGSANFSHFYYGANEDTYIRGGKAGSNVLINDIAGQGNVGIGLTNPGYILDVNRRIRIRHTVDGTPDDNTAGIWYNNSANVEGAFSGMKTDTEVGLFLGGNWRFWVNSGGQGYLNGALIQTSDQRLKKDFTKLNNSLTDIYKINGYHFKWKEEARNKDLQTGLIAQEVQKIFPELVQTDEKGFLSVNYIGLIPHLIEAVKELKNENKDLKELRNENKDLRNRLEKIEVLLSASNSSTGK